MMQFLSSGGILMWVLYFFALIIISLTLKNLIILTKKDEREKQETLHSINAIIFWGMLSAVFGLFAHFYGVYLAMQAISRAADISPAIVAKGYSYSLVTILTGMTIFMSSGIFWFGLRFVEKKNKIVSA